MNADLHGAFNAPMTLGLRPVAFRVVPSFQRKHGLIVLDPIRTLDRVRSVKRLGAPRPQTLALALQNLLTMFAS
jgi:mRNA interferase MazF